ncbi:hypothetical protein HBI81_012120 [Parastagonospora nodorum]|nr:hypothetical protein HBH51_050600 [Parastagonospora nodorum]KAH4038452.1 hypothetical protein HBI09_051500 [Parastagonospora nodorum]KAH4130066.1 hypothetical protein HBH47_025010 [Parastagonospora nodorum]KAH4816714.1 hypothetical protein HBH61_053290 [Parastagonospora nodorum]KAH4999721.1 hypothetical protein HBI77_170350 [Parastagonospora nodorum]
MKISQLLVDLAMLASPIFAAPTEAVSEDLSSPQCVSWMVRCRISRGILEDCVNNKWHDKIKCIKGCYADETRCN